MDLIFLHRHLRLGKRMLNYPLKGSWALECGLFSNLGCFFYSATDVIHLGMSKEKIQGAA